MGVPVVTVMAAVCLTLISHTTQSCTRGSIRECKKAEFAPGSTLAGEGFDITKMQRTGVSVIDMSLWRGEDNTCLLCRNPYQEGKMQKVPLAVVDWRPSEECSVRVISTQHQSSESLMRSSTSSVENNWEAAVGLQANVGRGSLMLAGSKSKLADYSLEKMWDKFTFFSQKVFCSHYSYRVSNQAVLHPEFQRAVNLLPKKYTTENKQHFFKLIDTFGTHSMTKVTLGGMVQSVTSIRRCLASLQGLTVDEIQMCLNVEAEVSVGRRSHQAGTELKRCQAVKNKLEAKESISATIKDRFTEVVGGNTTERDTFQKWLSSVPGHPEVMSYSLDPLHELLPSNLPVRRELRKAIRHYILERGLWQHCPGPCVYGIKRDPEEPCVCSCDGDPGLGGDCCPTKRGLARVIITVVGTSGLWGDYTTATDAYVKVLNSQNMEIGRTPVIWDNDSPQWNMDFDLGYVILSQTSTVIEVWDEDSKWDDDLLGTCTINLMDLGRGGWTICGKIKIHSEIAVTCGPSLSGSSCSEYISSPVDGQHIQPIPEEILMKMGVFEDDELPPQLNVKNKGVHGRILPDSGQHNQLRRDSS
ncbi:perforin-1-like [Sardina pilchardus]|uniref:perforin-1-like n=1 Tax=Sardina pilchardus TaxID=27697 RepID=UPI002E10524A